MRIEWETLTDREYTSGIEHGVLYPADSPGVAWNGLISVTETSGSTQDPKYFDGQRYFIRNIESNFAGSISAFTYPDELEPYIGLSGAFTAQNRGYFGLCYRTNNEIHLIYNIRLAPSKREFVSEGTQIVPADLDWSFTTLPVKIPGGKPSAHIVILVEDSNPVVIDNLETLLYGDDENDPSLPSVEDVLDLFEGSAILQITDHGDGTWTAIGPDDVITIFGDGTFKINYSTVVIIDADTFRVSSL